MTEPGEQEAEREPPQDKPDPPEEAPPLASARPGGAKTETESGTEDEDDDGLQSPSVINFAQFNSNFTAPGGFFGTGHQQTSGARAATGWVDAAEITATLEYYVHPRPCYDLAAKALDEDRVVVLTAPNGTGKRSGAIALVRGFAEPDRCVVLSPDLSVGQLAKVKFKTGVGYILLDRMNERVAQPDFAWRQVRDQVRAKDAYLVVTSIHQTAAGVEAVQHIEWQPPDSEAVLRRRLHQHEPALIDEAVAGMPGQCTLRDAVAVTRLIAAGVLPADAWDRHGDSAVHVVREWFAAPRTPADFTMITTLAFAVGSNQRTFETLQQDLDSRLVPEVEPTDGEDEPAAPEPVLDTMYGGRRSQAGHPLLTTQTVADGPINRSVLVFADPRYRQWVLDELWATCKTPYWDAVRDWLSDAVVMNRNPHLELAIATGLAQLARASFDEVIDSYLNPWALNTAGPAGKAMAAQVLWCICLDDELAGAALSVAREWIESGIPARRSTAVMAFGGMLGVRFPTDAVRLLWQQVKRGDVMSRMASERLGYLFAALVECDENARMVTKTLRERLAEQRARATTDALKKATFHAVLGLLRFREWESDHPVCAVALTRQPAVTRDLAALFAGVLVNRPYRDEAKNALMTVVKALPKTCPDDPAAVARRFGRALGAALPPDERPRLFAALRTRQDTRNDNLAGIFLRAIVISEVDANNG